jgi:hypothetical protein
VMHVRLALRHRLPPPAALPRPDWATRQTHAALTWLLIAAMLGVWLSTRRGSEPDVAAGWWYGIAGLVGFLSQVIAGMQGRLVPMYAWYGAFEAGGHTPPPIAVHALPSPRLARLIFLTWTIGVPALAAGLAGEHARTIRLASSILLLGVVLNGAQLARTFARARTAA